MTGTQAAMLGFVLVSFAAGWWVRGGRNAASDREAQPPAEVLLRDGLMQLDRTGRAALALLAVASVEADERRPAVRAACAALQGHLRRLGVLTADAEAVLSAEHPVLRQLLGVERAIRSLTSMAESNPRSVTPDQSGSREAIAAAEAGLETALFAGSSSRSQIRRSSSSS